MYAIRSYYDFPDSNFRRAATHRLREHLPDKSEQVWRSARDWQSRLKPSRPRYNFSLNLLMRYFEWNLSLYRAVQEQGMSQVEAGEFVETVAVEYYQPVAARITSYNVCYTKLLRHRRNDPGIRSMGRTANYARMVG